MLPLLILSCIVPGLLAVSATERCDNTQSNCHKGPSGAGTLRNEAVGSQSPIPYLDAPPAAGDNEQWERYGEDLLRPSLPQVVRKMGLDAGEKFFPEYWQFGPANRDQTALGSLDELSASSPTIRLRSLPEDDRETFDNSTMFFPPFMRYTEEQVASEDILKRSRLFPNLLRRTALKASKALDKRAFTCPGGTSACTSIQRPDSCCATGETCQIIKSGPLGDVGCCPQGRDCSGGLNNCDDGFKSCPGLGNGCCIPNFNCVQGGCAPDVKVSTVTTTSSTSTSKSSSTSSAPPTTEVRSMTTTVLVTETGTTRITTTIITTAVQTSTSRETSTSRSSSSSQSTTSTNDNPNPAIRPTTDQSSSTTTFTGTGIAGCPTGYYQCSAIFHGGCCRVGRDCGISSCPSTESTLLANTRGITISVPAGVGAEAKITADASKCATGWFLCSPDQNGGCCPTGYDCQTDSECTAAPQNTLRLTGEVPKGQPFANDATASLRLGWWLMLMLGIGSAILLMRM